MNENRTLESSVSDSVQDALVNHPSSDNQVNTPVIYLQYKGISRGNIVSKFMDATLRCHHTLVYNCRKTGSCFRIKDKISLEHQLDHVFTFRPEYNSARSTGYVGENNVKFGTWSYEPCYADKKSTDGYTKIRKLHNLAVCQSDFEIFDKGLVSDWIVSDWIVSDWLGSDWIGS